MLSRWTFDQEISCRECVLIKLKKNCSVGTFSSTLIILTKLRFFFFHCLQNHNEFWFHIFGLPDNLDNMKFHTKNRNLLQAQHLDNL